MSWKPLLRYGTRLFAKERKLTLWPSPLSEGTRLLPFEGDGALPAGWLAKVVLAVQVVVVVVKTRHVLRTKTFSTPLEMLRPRLFASEANATNCPVAQAPVPPQRLTLGCSLKPFAGAVPSTVETRIVEGAGQVIVSVEIHVSRT